ncbi:UPF0565 protein C2orf69 homolog isoform X2 [Gigantopelta aegis]|uniref:UPF0565 protein C2orf69 homolog isoform X2 n=1 Tax=Gigantopelta aegis TaxID=1735272 RepID=UPI001B88A36A|nr:UPF0565 protein C2orf69 homolog isoform X2 [Gigantopelta aegis]
MQKLINRTGGFLGVHRFCLTIYSFCTMSSSSGESVDNSKTGDRDYPEYMQCHPVNKRYSQWNLEETCRILQKRFRQSAIFVIKATKMHLNTFSVYSNFVESNDFGCPTHQPGFGSWRQLKTMYDNILLTVSTDSEKVGNTSCTTDSCSASCEIPLTVIGFSKGCIVLNQLLYDSKETEDDPELSAFVKKIKEFYWLDGGHSGGRNTWVKDKDVVRFLSTLPVKVFVHVTPYQVKDPMRAWIGKEQRRFVKLLKEFGVDVDEALHFDAEPGSIENHFKVLTVF